MKLTIVVARARNGVIGRDNALPWHLPEDLRHFKATTIGHPIIMGRHTFESIGRALPGRRTIVVTRNPDWSHCGCERAASLPEAIALAAAQSNDPSISCNEAFVVGGARLYRDALALADAAIVTEIELDPEGDARFDALGPPDWRLAGSERHRSQQGIDYRIDRWERVRRPSD
jgi:dihydrofolate reductase